MRLLCLIASLGVSGCGATALLESADSSGGSSQTSTSTSTAPELPEPPAPLQCGAQVCSGGNTTWECNSGGQCVVSKCDAGFGDCDFDPTNGCEVDLATAPFYCGTCNDTECFGIGAKAPGTGPDSAIAANTLAGMPWPILGGTGVGIGVQLLDVLEPGPPAHFRLALYSDAGGVPGKLLAATEVLTSAPHQTVVGAIPETSLPYGHYWMMVLSDKNLDIASELGKLTAAYAQLTSVDLPADAPMMTSIQSGFLDMWVVVKQ